jgi:hypothetical protein
LDHDNPVRAAYCRLFFAHNGGEFGTNGLPIIGTIDEEGKMDAVAIRSLCPHPFDCGTCPLLTAWVVAKQAEGWAISWECDDCLRRTQRSDKLVYERIIPGYYQAGRNPDIPRDSADYDPDRPKLDGCLVCGYESSFIQLVLRRPIRNP